MAVKVTNKIKAAKATLYHAIDALSKLELIDEEKTHQSPDT